MVFICSNLLSKISSSEVFYFILGLYARHCDKFSSITLEYDIIKASLYL